MRSVDVAVVGCGVMGAAAGAALARRGREVLVLERFEVGHRHGSSHGRARIFRLSYDEPRYVRMATEALDLWRALEARQGTELLIRTGGLDAGDQVPANVAALRACGVPHELLDPEEARFRFDVSFEPGTRRVLHQADAATVRAERAVLAFTEELRAGGGELRERTRVVALHPGAAYCDLETEEERIRARVVVVAAGAWARSLLAPAGLDIPTTVTRETVAFFPLAPDYRPPALLEWSAPPRYALLDPAGTLKAAEHHAGPVVDPDAGTAEPDPGALRRLSAWVRERFPRAAPEPVEAETCLYTNTPDESFILERRGSVVIGSPCSGHGFKFAPLIGERLADLAG